MRADLRASTRLGSRDHPPGRADRAGEADPPCTRCGEILKPATVMFGQALEPGVFERAAAAAGGCDLMLAIGSTLIVEPAASLCAIATGAGAALVIVNRDPTSCDRAAIAVIRDPIGTAVPRIAGQLLAASRPQASSARRCSASGHRRPSRLPRARLLNRRQRDGQAGAAGHGEHPGQARSAPAVLIAGRAGVVSR